MEVCRQFDIQCSLNVASVVLNFNVVFWRVPDYAPIYILPMRVFSCQYLVGRTLMYRWMECERIGRTLMYRWMDWERIGGTLMFRWMEWERSLVNPDVQVDGVGTYWRNTIVQVDRVGTGLSDL